MLKILLRFLLQYKSGVLQLGSFNYWRHDLSFLSARCESLNIDALTCMTARRVRIPFPPRHFKFKNTRKVSFSTVSGFLFVKTYLYWLNPVLSNERTEHGHPQNQTRPRNRLPERGRWNLLFPHIRSTEHAGQSASKLVTRKKQTTDSTSEIMEKIHFVTVAVLNPISVICYSI